MVKLYVMWDSMYPVYHATPDNYSDPNAPEMNLTPQEYEDYLRVQNEWRQWQSRLSKLDPVAADEDEE